MVRQLRDPARRHWDGDRGWDRRDLIRFVRRIGMKRMLVMFACLAMA